MRYNTAHASPPAVPRTGYGSIDDDHDELLNLATATLDLSDNQLPAAFESAVPTTIAWVTT